MKEKTVINPNNPNTWPRRSEQAKALKFQAHREDDWDRAELLNQQAAYLLRRIEFEGDLIVPF